MLCSIGSRSRQAGTRRLQLRPARRVRHRQLNRAAPAQGALVHRPLAGARHELYATALPAARWVLRAHGDPSGANDVLYAARERERSEAWKAKAWHRWLGLWLLRWTIGYGLGWRYFLVLIWIGLLTLGGAVMLWKSGADKLPSRCRHGAVSRPPPLRMQSSTKQGLSPRSTSSPIPRRRPPRPSPKIARASSGACGPASTGRCRSLNSTRRTRKPLPSSEGGPGYLLYFQALAGYVLAGFLAAGLAGLTQSRG